MATASTTPQRKKEIQIPRRRGQIKAQIFKGMAKTVVSAVSKAKEALAKNSDGKSSSSAITTPPQSGYNSEGSGDIS